MVYSATTSCNPQRQLDQSDGLGRRTLLAAQGEKNSDFTTRSRRRRRPNWREVDAEQLKQSTFGSGRLAEWKHSVATSITYSRRNLHRNPATSKTETLAQRLLPGVSDELLYSAGNVDAMCEHAKELGFLSGFRGYGENMAKTLGLGRLARQALKPLIQVLVADPLLLKLQEDYRPKRLAQTPRSRNSSGTPTFELQMRKELAQTVCRRPNQRPRRRRTTSPERKAAHRSPLSIRDQTGTNRRHNLTQLY